MTKARRTGKSLLEQVRELRIPTRTFVSRLTPAQTKQLRELADAYHAGALKNCSLRQIGEVISSNFGIEVGRTALMSAFSFLRKDQPRGKTK